jgi:hypothetical protein
MQLPGMDSRALPGDPVLANRLLAVMCAARVTGTDPRMGRAGHPKVRNLAMKMYKWLQDTDDMMDGYARRLLLATACDHVVTSADGEHYLGYAQWFHKEMSALTYPDRFKGSKAV